jgi:hypothetical protein
MGIDKRSSNEQLIENVLGAPLCEDTPNKEPKDPLPSDFTCTPDPIKAKAHG